MLAWLLAPGLAAAQPPAKAAEAVHRLESSAAWQQCLGKPDGERLACFDGWAREQGDLISAIEEKARSVEASPTSRNTAPSAQAKMCVIDGNLSPESLEYLCQNVTSPLFYDPVSCAKAKRIGGNIGSCYAIKPNRFEAGFLSGKSCDTLRGIYRASDWFLEQGVKRVFIDLIEEGVFWADAEGCGVVPAETREATTASFVGDAMSAAIIDGCVRALPAEECAHLGALASAAVMLQEK